VLVSEQREEEKKRGRGRGRDGGRKREGREEREEGGERERAQESDRTRAADLGLELAELSHVSSPLQHLHLGALPPLRLRQPRSPLGQRHARFPRDSAAERSDRHSAAPVDHPTIIITWLRVEGSGVISRGSAHLGFAVSADKSASTLPQPCRACALRWVRCPAQEQSRRAARMHGPWASCAQRKPKP
jgi:hypothetical protein